MSRQFSVPQGFRDELSDALLEHAATLAPRQGNPRRGNPRRGNPRRASRLLARRRLVPALVLAAILAGAGLILRSGGALAPQRATAAGVLRASAAALERFGGSRAIGPGEYFYTRMLEWWRYSDLSPHPYVVRSVYEEWVARDGHGRSRYDVIGVTGAARNRGDLATRSTDARRPGSRRPFLVSPVPSPGILLSYAELRNLPTNPARLSAAIDRLIARHHVERLFPQRGIRTAIRFEIVELLAEEPSSAAVRSTLYRVLATTPGIRLLGRTRDSIGRDGMAVGDRVGDIEFEVIIDPATGDLLQASRTLLHRSKLYFDGKQPPGLINRSTFLATGLVASTHARVR